MKELIRVYSDSIWEWRTGHASQLRPVHSVMFRWQTCRLPSKELDVDEKQTIPDGQIEEHVKTKSQPIIPDYSAQNSQGSRACQATLPRQGKALLNLEPF